MSLNRRTGGRTLDLDAARLAVAASVRHRDTDYDELLMSGIDRKPLAAGIRPH
jgi:hypothetical protein